MSVFFDIETAAADNAREFCKEPKDKRSKSIEDQLEDAALSAITGKVLAVGVLVGGDPDPVLIHSNDESQVLAQFWSLYRNIHSPGDVMGHEWIGFNCDSFDLPFLWRRSIINNIKPPQLFGDRGYPLPHFIDLRKRWQCGDKTAHGSLDVIARLCGLGGKSGDGAQFAALYGNEETRRQALEYLANDLRLTKAIAERMGVV